MTRVSTMALVLVGIGLAGCRTTESPFPRSYAGASLDTISKLRAGDTAEEVIGKLGSPASVEVIVPWLMYYATDQKGFYYRVAFDLTKAGELKLSDKLVRVTLTSGLFDGSVPQVVWPKDKGKHLKERANQSSEPTPTSGTSAAEQPRVPAAVVAHL